MPAAALTILWPICWALTQQLVDLGNRARHILGKSGKFQVEFTYHYDFGCEIARVLDRT